MIPRGSGTVLYPLREDLDADSHHLPPASNFDIFAIRYDIPLTVKNALLGTGIKGPHFIRHLSDRHLVSGVGLTPSEAAMILDAEERWRFHHE